MSDNLFTDVYEGEFSLEERILLMGNRTIVRARFLDVEEATLRSAYDEWNPNTDDISEKYYYMPALKHRFDVLEYLQGEGSDEIYAYVVNSDSQQKSKRKAGKAARNLVAQRSTKPYEGGREAILFLYTEREEYSIDDPEGGYLLGFLSEDEDSYSIASEDFKV